MADFKILHGNVIWLHNTAWKAGQEDALQAAGFPVAMKERKAATGQIEYAPVEVPEPVSPPPAPKGEPPAADEPPNATDGAVQLAEAEGVDLAEVTGTGSGGRITKGDVEAFLKSREDAGEQA